MKITVTACDGCGGIPEDDNTDHVIYLRCGHASCGCMTRRALKRGEVIAWPQAYCEKCKRVVDTNYAK